MCDLIDNIAKKDASFQLLTNKTWVAQNPFKYDKLTKLLQILRHIQKACSYISKNNQFVRNERLSLRMLISTMKLIECKNIFKQQDKVDQLALIHTIKNILNRSKQCNQHFFEEGGSLAVLNIFKYGVDYSPSEDTSKSIS